jgi:hypothetical protein
MGTVSHGAAVGGMREDYSDSGNAWDYLDLQRGS